LSRALRVGLTGKFGSGKSTVSRVFREQGIIVVDSDQLAKDLMTTDAELMQQLTAILGPESYKDGELNRAHVADRIFNDTKLRLSVESVVHPAVFRAIEQEFEAASAGQVVAVESALIFQTFLWRVFDYIVLVDASDDAILARSQSSGKFSEDTVKARLAEQDYRQDYVTGADFSIANDSRPEVLATRATMIATILKALAKQALPDVPLRSIQEEEDDEIDSDTASGAEESGNHTIH
jgi:dephospho-CoA kinase